MHIVMEDAKPIVKWYNPPKRQLDILYNLNAEYNWGITRQELVELKTPHFQPRTRTELLLLCLYLPAKDSLSAVKRNLVEHLRAIRENPHTKSQRLHCWDEHFELNNLSLRNYPLSESPKVRWRAYDYAAGWDPNKCRKSIIQDSPQKKSIAHAASEVLSAMLFMPAYGPSMDGRTTPYANIAGYDIDGAVPAVEWVHHEHLLSFFSNYSGLCNGCWATPTVRNI